MIWVQPVSYEYQVQLWIGYAKDNAEDEIEEQLREFLKANNIRPRGVVTYRVFRNQ